MRPWHSEKAKYWEARLHEALLPVSLQDLLVASWALESCRYGRIEDANRFVEFPQNVGEYGWTRRLFVPPWSIDTLINEKFRLGNFQGSNTRRLNLRFWNGFSHLVNLATSLSNVESVMDHDQSAIIPSLQRLFLPQYNWQVGFENIQRLARAWATYCNPPAEDFLERNHGISLTDLVQVGFVIYCGTERTPFIKISDLYDLPLERIKVWKALKLLGASTHEHHTSSIQMRNPALPRNFQRSTIVEKPLVLNGSGADLHCVVPSRDLLLSRITDGLYYDVVQDDRARQESGTRFEKLCLLLVAAFWRERGNTSGAIKFGGRESCDIVHQGEGRRLLIECKARRIPLKVRQAAEPWREDNRFYDDIIKGIIQIWRTEDIAFDDDSSAMGLVLTYDAWTIVGSQLIPDLLASAHEVADRKGIPKESRIPIAFSDFIDFDICLRSAPQEEILNAILASTEQEKLGYLLSTLIDRKDIKYKCQIYSELVDAVVPWWRE